MKSKFFKENAHPTNSDTLDDRLALGAVIVTAALGVGLIVAVIAHLLTA